MPKAKEVRKEEIEDFMNHKCANFHKSLTEFLRFVGAPVDEGMDMIHRCLARILATSIVSHEQVKMMKQTGKPGSPADEKVFQKAKEMGPMILDAEFIQLYTEIKQGEKAREDDPVFKFLRDLGLFK